MKTLLLKPCWSYPADPGDSTYNRNWPPLSLLTSAAILRNAGFDVEVLDAGALRLDHQQVAEYAGQFDQIFIASASLDRWQCPNLKLDPFLHAVYALRTKISRLFVLGTHGTVRPKHILDLTEADAVIIGEPEMTILEICRGTPLTEIKGLIFYRDNEIVQTPPAEGCDLSAFPIPAYDLVDIDKYEYEVMGSRFALLEASRGCPYQCIFCVKSMYGKKFRVKSIPQFIREVDYIIDVVKAKNVYFIDLEFTINRDLVEAVCNHLIQRGVPISWCCQTRTDSVDQQLLVLMKSAGCRIVHFGVETGSDRIRNTLNKGITRKQIENGLRAARAAGLQTVCFFMFGLPGETLADMRETIRLAKQLNPTYASFHIALPYPGTEFHRQVESDLGTELFPYAYTGIVSYPELERITKKAFRSYYLRPRYIAGRLKERDLASFFHQAKFFFSYLKHRLWS